MSRSEFLTQKNETMLDRILYSDFQRRNGGDLTDKQKDRLIKTVHHYMMEVSDKNKSGVLTDMNKEVLGLVVQDMTAYLRRQTISESSDVDSRMDSLQQDVGNRFTALQNERGEQKTLMPPAPDFRIAIEDSNDIPALSLFELAKKNREAEAKRHAEQGTFLKDLEQGSGIANANPTLSKPEAVRIKPILPQQTIIPQDDILSYKENEYNLVVYSLDRDWYNNQKENRYNFSVTFNPANNGQGFKYSPSANMRFQNIVRIEMVKAIVPAEGIDNVILLPLDNSPKYAETILSLPGISIHVDELESNVYGTDDTLDRSFAMLQYDAQWVGNTAALNNLPNSGYYAMIPKFLKCQRVYTPTPLATLTKMTIQLNKPNGTLVNSNLDTLDISGIAACNNLPTGAYSEDIGNFIDTNGNSRYYLISTKTWFNVTNFVIGDIIQIKGINTSLISNNDSAKADFKSYFENNNGLIIINIGSRFKDGAGGIGFNNSTNELNYANVLFVKARFNDPTTGSLTINPFGGTDAASQALEVAIRDVNFAGARLINTTKQTQLTFRIITRDMDSATRIRPNNA